MPVALASHYTQRETRWTAWKAKQAVKLGLYQHEEDDLTYTVWFYDGPEVHSCIIYKGEVPDGVLAGYSQVQNDADKTDFETSYKPISNRPIVQRTSDGKTVTSVWPTEGTRKTVVTHNWADKTTWYQKATRVVEEAPTATTPGTLYTLAHSSVIDAYHGKLWDEDYLKDASNNGFRVVVKVNGVVKTEQDPHLGTGGDYVVDYHAGTITFPSTIATDATVLVTYHYAGSSEFTIAPLAGKALKISRVEVQFSSDVDLLDTVDFIAYGNVEAFAPQYCTTNGGPYPPGTKIPLATTRYKTMYDFQAESNGALPIIPPIGGTGWRGIQNNIIVFPWDYAAMIVLLSSKGMEIRIKLQHDVPFGGEFGTATMYCLSEGE